MKSIIALIVIISLSACTMDAEVASFEPSVCVNRLDGETFSISKQSQIIEVRAGIGADSSVRFVDDTGKEREITSSEDAYWKCDKMVKQ